MDAGQFDRLSRFLAASGTRRGALGALLAGALGLSSLPTAVAKQNKHRQRRERANRERTRQEQQTHRQGASAKKRQKTSAEGPCGNGSAKANSCKNDADCCTRFCDKKKNRCRCKKPGQSCSEDRNCCATLGQPMTCQSGTCQTIEAPPAPPTASPPPPSPLPCAGQCAPTMGCGDDRCGGSCGSCAANETCQSGTCACTPDCTGKTCGPIGCGESCGDCPAPKSCVNGRCVCVSKCSGKECGDDGCGSTCGSCAAPSCQVVTCNAGRCNVAPVPGCCSVAVDCAMNNPCMTDSCQGGMCRQDPVASGTACTQSSGSAGVCNASGQCVECLNDTGCNDGNACTSNTCQNGSCQYAPLAAGGSCTRSGGGTGVCDGAGECVQCMSDAHCADGNPCHIPRCEPTSHTCAFSMAANYDRCGGTNYCFNGECYGCTAAGAPCGRHQQCCDYHTNAGHCYPLRNVCCRRHGQSCQTNGVCCLQNCYRPDPSSSFGTCMGG